MRCDREELAQVLYYVHEHCRLPGFYDAEGVSEYDDGTRTHIDWAVLKEVTDDPKFVDQNYFRQIASRFVDELNDEVSDTEFVERLAQLLSSVHSYQPGDYSFWVSLPEHVDDPEAVHRTFFRELATSLIPRLQEH